MAKVFQTPTKSVLQSSRWSERLPLREQASPDFLSRKTPRRTPGCHNDRFIPTRKNVDLDLANFLLAKENSVAASPKNEEYKKQLAGNMLRESDGNSRILSFSSKPPPPPEGFENSRKALYSQNVTSPVKAKKMFRHIPQAPERTLDAPELLDDYYLNLLDWSSNNVVAIALGNTVYLWDASTSSIEELMTVGDEGPVTSVCWAPDGQYIAIGLNNADVQLWDSHSLRQVRSLKGHCARVGALAWNGGPVLSSGGRDNVIFNHDVRIRDHITGRMTAHEQEVCGLKWSPSGQQLASGGNDNLLHIWDAAGASSQGPSPYLHRLDDHQAAVKALAWCPFQANLLASGGGTADRCIKFWNTHTGACVNSIDTQSQVCALQWSKHEKEILSSHGFSQNQLCLWKYPSMVKMTELTGHTSRVLHLAQSPDGYTVASAAGDETLRFWQVFGSPDTAKVPVKESWELHVTRESYAAKSVSCGRRPVKIIMMERKMSCSQHRQLLQPA